MRAKALLTTPLLFLAVWFAQPSAPWRDGAEFVLSGVFLDIAHPAGFPLYAQLSNLFTFVPIGPLAFRVHLFSGVLAVLLALTCGALVYRLLTQLSKLPLNAVRLLTALGALLPLLIEPIARQALTAEVYLLNGVLLAASLLLYLSYRQSGDRRLLLLLAFLSGLTLANHVASGVILLGWMGVLLLADRAAVRTVLAPAFLCGALGLSAYLYLPVRALANPPLNTGSPDSAPRFIAQITNERDRVLRAPAPEQSASESSWATTGFSAVAHDLRRMQESTGPLLLVLVPLGVLLLPRKTHVLLLVPLIGGWIFFQGWDPDPWIPTFTAMVLIATTGIGSVSSRLPQSIKLISVCLSSVLLLAALPTTELRASLTALPSYEGSANATIPLLRDAKPDALILTEVSWFGAKYLRDIEGYRSDLTIINQPALLYPELFGGRPLIGVSAPGSEQGTSNLAQLLNGLPQTQSVIVEPSALTRAFIAPITQLTEHGHIELLKGRGRDVSPQFTPAVLGRLTTMQQAEFAMPSAAIRADARQYREVLTLGYSHTLRQLGEHSDRVTLLEAACQTNRVTGEGCGEPLANELGLALTDAGNPQRAIEIFTGILTRGTRNHSAIETNLNRAKSR